MLKIFFFVLLEELLVEVFVGCESTCDEKH